MAAPWERWEDPRRVLARHGLRPSPRHSQNFLTARTVVETIAMAVLAGEPPRSEVLEIGPGVGTLSTELLRRGARVTALEKDPRMVGVLETEFASLPALRVVAGDATTLRIEGLVDPPALVAGNLPYAITGVVLRRLVEQHRSVRKAVLMIQREVRDRLVASPGTKAYGTPTVFVQNVFQVTDVCSVPPGAFHPPPKVRSSVVSLSPRAAPRTPDNAAFTRTVRAAFALRRKTLRNALRAAFDAGRVDAALAACGIDPGRRGETLSIEELGALGTALDGPAADQGSEDGGTR